MLIAIGSSSQNPTKVNATLLGFQTVWPDEVIETIGIPVESGVSDQPATDEETIQGATNRAARALEASSADYGVGIEGGFHKIGEYWFECGWVVIVDRHGTTGIASTERFLLPPKLKVIIDQGNHLGSAIDQFWNTADISKAEGFFGRMTNNHITRTEGCKHGVIVALARFLHPELF